MKKKIALINTKAANLHSVFKAFKYVGADIEITADISRIENSDSIVFPGVGSFGAVLQAVRENNLEEVIKKQIMKDKPFFGICVGMQALFESSEESPNVLGLGIFKGKVVKFKKAKKIPHIGWNDVVVCSEKISREKFYFVHSYYVSPIISDIVYSTTVYDGEEFPSVIKSGNLIATQFHPEKSGDVGLNFIREFL